MTTLKNFYFRSVCIKLVALRMYLYFKKLLSVSNSLVTPTLDADAS